MHQTVTMKTANDSTVYTGFVPFPWFLAVKATGSIVI